MPMNASRCTNVGLEISNPFTKKTFLQRLEFIVFSEDNLIYKILQTAKSIVRPCEYVMMI